MHSLEIKIHQLLSARTGEQESLECDLPQGGQLKGRLMRLDEGILFILEHLNIQSKPACVRCGKTLSLLLQNEEPSEWMFYEQLPEDDMDREALQEIDLKNNSIHLDELLRQELILLTPEHPRCPQDCQNFEDDSDTGVKALAGLKDLMKNQKE